MDGTTLCPHCNTRFRIVGEQLDAHQGMVRCGHCMQAFDARPGFIPDQPDPQLELPIVDQRIGTSDETKPEPAEPIAAEPADGPEITAPNKGVEPAATDEPSGELSAAKGEPPHDGALDFIQPAVTAVPLPAKALVIQAPPLVGIDENDEEETVQPPARPNWPWAVGITLLTLLLCLQGLYFFRIEVAARLPGLKPIVVGYCNLLGCSVPLPQNADLMSIESSELEADPAHADQITLVALLRNRASHVQAFPVLELTLNDNQGRELARRLFKPADYLPNPQTAAVGLFPNREFNISLRLDTTDLRPTGYRLVLLYPE